MTCMVRTFIFSLIWLYLVLFCCNSLVDHARASEGSENVTELKLDYGTAILLRFLSDVSSKEAKVGQLVNLQVDENVFKDGTLVIPKGTPARGQIINSMAKYHGGLGGQIVIANFYIILEQYQKIPLDGTYRIEGKEEKSSLVIGSCCLLGFLIKGKEAVINKGQTFKTVLARDLVIK